MRSVFLFMMVSMDGYYEGEDHALDWHNAANDEFTEFADRQLDEADTLVFGHRTYDMMAAFWPTQAAAQAAASTASRMNAMRKVVFSASPMEAVWENTEASTDPVTYITELKQRPGKSIAVLGSSNLATTLLDKGLIDELRIMVNPVLLGRGTPLFANLRERQQFSLARVKPFESGNVLLTYDCIMCSQKEANHADTAVK